MKRFQAILVAASLLYSITVSAGHSLQPTKITAHQPTYKVGIKVAEPFAYKDTDGAWIGVSVEFLEQLAEETGFKYELVDTGNINGLLDAAARDEVDFSIAAISMTPEREWRVDFSHPYFTTTQGILTKNDENYWLWIGKRIGLAALALLVGLYAIGFIMSRIEREKEINNTHKGAWWALVTLTTTGYGKFTPATIFGYIFGSMWMIASMFLLSVFTAYVTTTMTVDKLTSTPTNLSALYKTKTVALEGSTASQMLDSLGIRHRQVDNLEVALEMIEGDQSEALVHDKAMLDYAAQKSVEGNLEVWPVKRGLERYAIAFPSGSILREPVNRSILAVIESSAWKSTILKYFGSE